MQKKEAKKKRSLKQIEEEFRKLDHREKRINPFYDKDKLEAVGKGKSTNNNGRKQKNTFWNVLKTDEKDKEEYVDSNTGSTNSMNNNLSNFKLQDRRINTKVEELTLISKNYIERELTRRSPLLTRRVEEVLAYKNPQLDKKKDQHNSSLTLPTPITEIHERATISAPGNSGNPRATTLNDISKPTIIEEEKKLSKYDSPNYYLFEVKIIQFNEYKTGLFTVRIMDYEHPNERKIELKERKMSDNNCIIFEEPDVKKFNPTTLPWINKPSELLGKSLIVEVHGTAPVKTKIAKSIVKFDKESDMKSTLSNHSPKVVKIKEKESPLYQNHLANNTLKPETEKTRVDTLSPPSISNTIDRKLKVLKIEMPQFTVSSPEEKNTEEENILEIPKDLYKSEEIEEVTEDDIQQHREDRISSAPNQSREPLSPTSQKLKLLQEMRQEIKLQWDVQFRVNDKKR